MLDITTQANLLTDKLLQIAVGTLYRRLGWVGRTTKWMTDTVMENGASYNLPIFGTVATNDRAPGGPVVDTTESPSRRAVTIIEKETSFLVDPTWAGSEGKVKYEAQRIQSRANQLAQDVMKDIFETIATTGGLTSVGTLGAALVKADFDAAREALTNAEIPYEDRIGMLSAEQMSDVSNIAEYSDFEKLGIAGQHADGRIGRAAGFMLNESGLVYSPAAGQHVGILAHLPSIATVWPMQEEFTKGYAQKTEAAIDDLRLYILREYVDGYNGAERMTLSMRFGSAVHRDEGVVLANGQ